MSGFKMRILSFSKPRTKDAEYEVEEIGFDIELPYIPRAGDAISVSDTQDAAEVEDVLYLPWVTDELERITVQLKEPSRLMPFAKLAAEGWKSV